MPTIQEEKSSRIAEVKLIDNYGDHELKVGDKVMLEDFKSRINPSAEPAKWTEPFEISRVFMYGTIEIIHPECGKIRIGVERLMLLQSTRPHGPAKIDDLGKSG
ncbi:hypothetical protein LINGRAHAP2_LOCUS10871 [Linum grandiflorum]